ncbi:hypothetical protein [Bacillus safensis]|uniref:hypothetical protein n=1 Tax=Bacillus safensis TaxID=561879 RepID=UPI003983D7A2
MIVNGKCTCSSCEEERIALQNQLNNPFYSEVDAYRGLVKVEQLEKAAQKYSSPLTAETCSSTEFCDHAMQENYDQSVYLTAIRERISRLKTGVEILEALENVISSYLESSYKNEADYFKQAMDLLKENC